MTNDPKLSPSEQAQSEQAARDSTFLYKDSGILEKHGQIPPWLLAVVIALIIWGIYYLVAFWSPPQN